MTDLAPVQGEIVVVGASGHGRVLLDALEKSGRRVAGILDRALAPGEMFGGYRVLGADRDAAAAGGAAIIVGIGDNWARAQVARALAAADATFGGCIHPSAQIGSDVAIEAGTVILAGAVVNPGCRIGQHVIVNTGANIDHECRIESFASIAPGATLGGNVRVGPHTAIGLGASVVHGVSIGEHCVVGAGAVVLNDLPARCVAYGVPARVVRSRREGEPYLSSRSSDEAVG